MIPDRVAVHPAPRDRLHAVTAVLLLVSTALLAGCHDGHPPSGCVIDWQPSALAPVFYGIEDYTAADGAPGDVRMFYPSIDGAVMGAAILDGCGDYPLLLFLHGNCTPDADHFEEWYDLPATLARAGYVVAAPELPGISTGDYPWTDPNTDLDHADAVVDWARSTWANKDVVLSGRLGVVGHSWGGLLGASYANTRTVDAYASLSAGWAEWPSSPASPLSSLTASTLFFYGGADIYAPVSESTWSALAPSRHRVVVEEGEHWDYLASGATSCASDRGPCEAFDALARDTATMFFARYIEPEQWSSLSTSIPDTLVPPSLSLTTDQEFYAGSWLNGFTQAASESDCEVESAYVVHGIISATTTAA